MRVIGVTATWSDRGIPIDVETDESGVPRTEKDRRHYGGRTEAADLSQAAFSGNHTDQIEAAADPKTPNEARGHLVSLCATNQEISLRNSLLQNPALTALELDDLAGTWGIFHEQLTDANSLAVRFYEHPSCGSVRRTALTQETPTQVLNGTETPWDAHVFTALNLQCAARQLSLTANEIDSLARRWKDAMTQLTETAPTTDDRYYQWKRGLYLSAARLCTHPQISNESRSSVFDLLRRTGASGRISNLIVKEWAQLGTRAREVDWMLLEGVPALDLTENEADVAWSSIVLMADTGPHPLDAEILHKALTHARLKPEQSKNVLRRQVLRMLKKTPQLLDRLSWGRDDVYTYLTSTEQAFREIGIHGVTRLKRASRDSREVSEKSTPRTRGRV